MPSVSVPSRAKGVAIWLWLGVGSDSRTLSQVGTSRFAVSPRDRVSVYTRMFVPACR